MRQSFANDLGDSRSLVGVTDNVNQAKGDQDPAEWLPTYDKCRYLREWVAVKHRWRLTVDSAEKSALQSLASGCIEHHDHRDPGPLSPPCPSTGVAARVRGLLHRVGTADRPTVGARFPSVGVAPDGPAQRPTKGDDMKRYVASVLAAVVALVVGCVGTALAASGGARTAAGCRPTTRSSRSRATPRTASGSTTTTAARCSRRPTPRRGPSATSTTPGSQRVRCRTEVRTWYRDLAATQQALRWAHASG